VIAFFAACASPYDTGAAFSEAVSPWDDACDEMFEAEDYDVDGEPEFTRRSGMGADGRLLVRDEDWDADGQVDCRYTREYLAGGLLRKEEWLYMPEGYLIGRDIYAYDDRGLLQEVVDYDRDNRATSRREYDYDDRELLIEERLVDPDDGEVAARTRYEYDAAGLWVAREEESSHWDRTLRSEFTYDERQLLVESYTYWLGDPSEWSRATASYDAWGNLVEVIAEASSIEGVYQREAWEYEGGEFLVAYELDFPARGVAYLREEYQYDTLGRLLLTETDGGGFEDYGGPGYVDGVVDHWETYDYDDLDRLVRSEVEFPGYGLVSTWTAAYTDGC
jgi:hypothetical protein